MLTDRILSFLLLIIVSPFILLLLFITLISFKCNPIFTQIRTVNGKESFIFFKIRSMYKNAPNVPTSELKNANLYMNSWGRFLRLYSLDELLNLVSIVRGDMKFIGPRPILDSEKDLIELRVRSKINCKPGLTGLAQINGRDNITISRKVACDRYYDRNKESILLRLKILVKTFWLVIKGSDVVH